MKLKTTPTDMSISFDIVKVFDENDDYELYAKLDDTVSPDVVPFLGFFNPEIKGIIYIKSDLKCPHCGCDLRESTVEKIRPNKLDNVFRMVYRCSNKCTNKKYRTKLDKFIPRDCNYTENMQMFVTGLKYIEEISYRKFSEIIPGIFNINMPKSTIYDHYDKHVDEFSESVDEEIEEKIIEEGITSSGVYNYDEQFPKINKDEKVTLTMLDANTKYAHPPVIDDKDNLNAKLISKYWKNCMDGLPKEAIVTDGNTMYPQICEDLKIQHALCNFHAILNVRRKPYKRINYNNKQIRRNNKSIKTTEEKLVELNSRYHPKSGRIAKTDTKRRKLYDNIKNNNNKISHYNDSNRKYNKENNELTKYMDKISLVFKSKRLVTAKKRFNKLLEDKEEIPDLITDSFDNLKKNFDKLILHIENENIPSTNNLAELFFNVTCQRKFKKYY